jgi:hypothetical protein
MKVNTSLCWGIANQQDERGWHGNFYPKVHLVVTKLVPVETSSKVAASPLASGDPQVTLSHVECLPQALALDLAKPLCRPLCLALLELLFVAPMGWAQYPSQSLLWSTAQSSLHASMETTTKPSRRWQPPWVTSTTGLHLNHLVPTLAIPHAPH